MRAKHTSMFEYIKTGQRQYDVFLDIADTDKVYHRTFIGAVAWTDGNGRPHSRGWTMTPVRDPYPDQTRLSEKLGWAPLANVTRNAAAIDLLNAYMTVRDREAQS